MWQMCTKDVPPMRLSCASQRNKQFNCHRNGSKRAAPGVTLHCYSGCITPRSYDFIQCSSIRHPVHQNISEAERGRFTLYKRLFLSALYVPSLSPALILFSSFSEGKYMKRQAAQEILFRLLIAQVTQREGGEVKERERERTFFFFLLNTSLRGTHSPD